MEIILEKYNDISLKINHGPITGIYNCSEELLDVLKLDKLYEGNLIINDIKVENKILKIFKKRITIIEEDLEKYKDLNTVKELIIEIIKRRNIKVTNKKLIYTLKMVGLNKEYLFKELNELSTMETKLLLLGIALLNNSNLLIIKEPFKNIDLNNTKKLMNFYNRLIEDYQKNIIFISDDIEILYKYTEEIIICSNKYIYGKTIDVLQNVNLLRRNNVKIPEIVEITYLANLKKKAKLSYHKDIRDIIKDIYKHV